jgi:hypothetical protein
MLPEVYSLLMQSSVTSAAEQALTQSDERMREAHQQLESEICEARRELEAQSVERRAEVRPWAAANTGSPVCTVFPLAILEQPHACTGSRQLCPTGLELLWKWFATSTHP